MRHNRCALFGIMHLVFMSCRLPAVSKSKIRIVGERHCNVAKVTDNQKCKFESHEMVLVGLLEIKCKIPSWPRNCSQLSPSLKGHAPLDVYADAIRAECLAIAIDALVNKCVCWHSCVFCVCFVRELQ